MPSRRGFAISASDRAASRIRNPIAMITLEALLRALDLGGTFVFAISGAVAAVNRRADLFGILVLAFVAGNFGGISRDLVIGAVPPAAMSDWRYLLVSIVAGLTTFFLYAGIERLRIPVLIFDAVGLAFFAVAGAQKAIQFGMSPVMSALLGMLTGIGGGMVRDVLLNDIPQVLRSDLYAVAALAASCSVVIGHTLGFPYEASALVGGALCLFLRFMAIGYGWRLPVANLSAHKRTRARKPGEGR
ncbi:trimeric intracellular cation channel family protein [Bordetella bronchialis]|nr:trimeric intracellular cation channel family protein [Bordetella bronchialis]